MAELDIRSATAGDADAIWDIFHAVVAARDTYVFAPDTTRDDALAYWFGPGITSWVAETGGRVVGMSKLVANQRGLGRHVANASFMVAPAVQGLGVGRALGEHNLREARRQGFAAMQFNFVVSTNESAVRLWQRLGFSIAGTLPRVFQHGQLGLVDAYVMHRDLDDIVLTFGTPPAEAAVMVRPSAYAVVSGSEGRLAVVHAKEGVTLPGGGVDATESAQAAAARETTEETAVTVRIDGSLGKAIQFVWSEARGSHIEKHCEFFSASIDSPVQRAAEHHTEWLTPDEAERAVSHDSHAWAIRRWRRLSS